MSFENIETAETFMLFVENDYDLYFAADKIIKRQQKELENFVKLAKIKYIKQFGEPCKWDFETDQVVDKIVETFNSKC